MSDRRARQPGETPPIDPVLYWRADVRAALARHDFSAVYRTLKDEAGLSQRLIAGLTGQSQSEVSEILSGRRVLTYSVLERLVGGLSIPPQLAGMSWCDANGTYCGDVTVAGPPEGVSAGMLRRHLIAAGAGALVGHPVRKLGELIALADLGGPGQAPLPNRLSGAHVARVRDLTRRLAGAGNTCVSEPDVLSAATAWAARLLDVSGPEPVTRALQVAVAELHIEAGWAGFDAGLYNRAMYHYAHALELATHGGDAYCQATALNYAGLATVEHGHPDDGLKMLQLGHAKAWAIPPDDSRAVVVGVSGRAAVEACAYEDSATALAALGEPEAADRDLKKARELWTPAPSDPFGDLDRPAARMEADRGRLDVAESLAAASVRRWEGGSQVSRALSGIVLAEIHVRAGDSDGLELAHGAISSVGKLSSVHVRARTRLEPLVAALEARPGPDARELARWARQLATTRA